MTAYEIILILFSGSLLAGFLGSLSGLGGGMIIVPLLVLGLNVDIHYAIGASLIAVIATSTGASAAYIKEGFTNIRAAIFLETATTSGAIGGVAVAALLPAATLSLVFGLILLYCAFAAFYSNGKDKVVTANDQWASRLSLNGSCPSAEGQKAYFVEKTPLGFAIMFIAGALSGALGIGSGALKVLALDKVMGFPFKVSTSTSNFMIGVTAAASAGIYLHKGYIDPVLTVPVMLGVTLGAIFGARLLPHTKTKTLKKVFTMLIMLIAAEMIFKGFTGVFS